MAAKSGSGSEQARASYESVPYPGKPFYLTRPANLATLGRLHGIDTPPVAGARVLEIGCSDGGNLIPLAVAHRDTEFVGIDIAPGHIETARALAKRLGLTNITLCCLDLTRIDRAAGEFDYIVAHGVLSWVPTEVRDRLLQVCKERLTPDGIAYISYNTYPGWYLRGGLREMLRAATDADAPLAERAAWAREFLQFLASNVTEDDPAYSASIRGVAAGVVDDDSVRYIAHEYLADVLQPYHFRDFVDLAARHGLGYVADANIRTTATENLPAELRTALTRLGDDPISIQQCYDLLRGRSFRCSLLCHDERPRTPGIDPQNLDGTWIATCERWEETPIDLAPDVIAEFRSGSGQSVRLRDPDPKAMVLRVRDAYPRWTRCEESLSDATRGVLARLYIGGLIDVDVAPPTYATKVPQRPVATPLARRPLGERELVTSLRNRCIALDDEFARRLLPLLDGARGRSELIAECGDAAVLDNALLRLVEHALIVG